MCLHALSPTKEALTERNLHAQRRATICAHHAPTHFHDTHARTGGRLQCEKDSLQRRLLSAGRPRQPGHVQTCQRREHLLRQADKLLGTPRPRSHRPRIIAAAARRRCRRRRRTSAGELAMSRWAWHVPRQGCDSHARPQLCSHMRPPLPASTIGVHARGRR